jgi:hypothetical protein
MTTVYCNYALIDQTEEPDWVQMLLLLQKEKAIDNLELYRPFIPLTSQKLQSFIETSEKGNEKLLYTQNLVGLSQVFETWYKQTDKTRPDYHDIAGAENLGREFSHTHILKDFWVLSKCDIVITDYNVADQATKDSLHMLGRMMGLRTIGVCDRFLISPWAQMLNDFTVTTPALPELLEMAISKVAKRETNGI